LAVGGGDVVDVGEAGGASRGPDGEHDDDLHAAFDATGP
jgi:hypothetical protein